MKQVLCILLSAIMCLCIIATAVSCGEPNTPVETGTQTQTQADTSATETETAAKPAESETEATVTETEATVTETEATVTETEAAITETEATVTETEATVTETEAAVTETEATETETEATVTETEATETETEPVGTDTESETETDPPETTPSETDPPETNPPETTPATIVIPSEYADVDFAGKTFNIIYRYQTAEDTPSGWGQVFDLYVDEENPDDAMSSSVKFFTAYMASTFNCTVNGIPSVNPGGEMSTAISVHDPKYDMIIQRTGPNGYANGNYYNMLPMLNLDLTCWDTAVIRDLALGNKLYGITGNCSTSDDDYTWVMFFNKDLLDKENLEYPYQLVQNYKWTVDKFLEYSRACAHDVDGDGEINNATASDIYGFVTHGEHCPAIWIGCGIRMATPVQADGTIKTSCTALGYEEDVFDKVIEIMHDTATGYANKVGLGVPEGLRSAFTTGRGAFYGECLGNIGNAYQKNCLKDVEGLRFGIIPQPMYNEEQHAYYHYVNQQASFIGIPITANYETMKSFINVYGLVFEQTVQNTFITNVANAWVSDPYVADMMRLIFDSRVWDAGYWYDSSSIHNQLISDAGAKENRYATRAKGGEKKLQKSLTTLYDKIIALTV